MENTTQKKVIERVAPRNFTEAAITCRPYTSCGAICGADGIMRNFSSGGSYIETPHKYRSGTILIVRIVRYATMPSSKADEPRPRSICLAEVKWWQELIDENAIRYGIGLRYLE